MIPTTITLTAAQRAVLQQHLFPGDGCEAVAIALCGRRRGPDRCRLVVHRIVPVPYEQCPVRLPDRVTWRTEVLPPLLQEAERKGLSVVKIHGHGDFRAFSWVDDESDRALFPSLYTWLGDDGPHASAILMGDGSMFGRAVGADGAFQPLAAVNLVGDDVEFWYPPSPASAVEEYGRRVAQAFGAGTYQRLRRLKVGVVGCSGTGSVVIEQLARNCVGHLVLVDPDCIEDKNLNRILNSTAADARHHKYKVHVAERAIQSLGMGTLVDVYPQTLFDTEVVEALAGCDIVFGCMDSVDGRFLLNKLAAVYLIPYFDLGVKLEADGAGGVDQVCGSVHYLQPGGSSLVSRHVLTLEEVRAAGLKRTDPVGYEQQRKDGYIRGVQEDRPAVIQLNSMIASLALNELLARLHPFRTDPNGDYAIHRISLSHGIYEHLEDGVPCPLFAKLLGRGDIEPLLNSPELSREKVAA